MVKDIVVFSTADWFSPYWTNKQHMTRLLRERGFRILYVESFGLRAPGANKKDLKRLLTRLLRGLKPITQVEPGIYVLSPLMLPWKQHWPLVKAYNQTFLNFRIWLFNKIHRFKSPILWTYHPFIQGVLNHLTYSKLVYHCVDDLSAVPGIDSLALRQAERSLATRCHVIFNTSLNLQNRMSEIAPGRSHYFNNVADIAMFATARHKNNIPVDLLQIPEPRIGYVGVLSDYKVNFALILEIARLRPQWHWVLIGEEREGQNDLTLEQLKTLSNVNFLGYRSYAEIPAYLSGMDVATLPTLLNDYTRSMFPMKFFEYLAAGLPVVSTALPALAEHQALFLRAETATEFVAAIEKLLAQTRVERAVPLDQIESQNWQTRLDKMLETLNV